MPHGRGFASARRRLDALDAFDTSAGVGDDADDVRSAELTDEDEALDLDDEAPAGGRQRAGRRSRVFRAVMAAILVLAVGFGVGVWVGTPHRPADDSADAGFTRDMMTHHAQAVTMASLEYRVTDDAALRQIAIDMTLTQQAQIGLMIGWLRTWDLNPTTTRPQMAWMPDGGRALIVDGRMPGMASDTQLQQLRTLTGTARDQLFIQLMIAHHLGGIHMADAALARAKDDQVLYLANQIKTSQQSEIDALQQSQKRLSGAK